ncbi:hypothetical protein ACI6QG_13900 [Roseococcus sp. DSY-14]|uniref:hypothetical protein n=1 Tax=Roseococcus sp. DSY-14 TaxID=3369650 RepID=UPI00387AEA78
MTRLLHAALGGTLAFGLALLLLPGPTQAAFNGLLFGQAALPAALAPAAGYIRFLYAVLGAVIAGWALTLLLLPLRRDRAAWRAAMAGWALWFALDSAASLLLGFWPNALLNAGFFLLVAVPLWRLRPRRG